MDERALKPQERNDFSDGEVVRRVRAGQTDLFEILMRRYNQRVYRLSRAVLRSDAEAQDVVQEAWVRAYEHLDQFEGRAEFSTWLCRIAIHEAWARMRRSRRYETIEPRPTGEDREMKEASVDPNPEGAAYGREVGLLVQEAVDALPEGYRTVFVLRQIEELSTAETAECLELSEETVKTRLHRARSALRQQLLEKAGRRIREAFPFLGPQCDRMVETVLTRIQALKPAN